MPSHDRVDVSVKRGAASRMSPQRNQEQRTHEPSHHLVTLQRSIGNAQVARLLAQREGMEEEELQMQRDNDSSHSTPEVGLEGGTISDELSGRINAKRGGGVALDSGTRASMEGAFGSSFADVRVHTDGESDALNRSVSAKAFTTGSDIFFSRNASPSDTNLLAHELTHVVQQRGAGPASGRLEVGPAGDHHEVAASSAASAVSSGGSVASAQRMEDASAEALARQELPEEEELQE